MIESMFFARMEARSLDDAAENARAVSNVLFQGNPFFQALLSLLSTVSDRLAELEVPCLYIAMFPFFVNLTLQQHQMHQRMNSVEALVATVEGHVLVLGTDRLAEIEVRCLYTPMFPFL